MKILTVTLVCCILFAVSVTSSKGHIGGSLERCTCHGQRQRVKRQLIAKVQLLPPSVSCSKFEILVTLKNNKKACVDPKGKQGKRIIKLQSDMNQGKRQNRKPKNRRNRQEPS
ncbi:C-X-C motif chemokine 2-like [Sardina pilchardus]|uniref:C-X-C motif chemokine 2-like n=1 Tax=Sardina pilchardus TaxID=27697 RepID=UPI002E0FDF6D